MAGAEFASCWLKLGRAEEHFNAFDSELVAWRDSTPYVITHKSNAEGSRYGLVINIRNPPPLDKWSLMAGDCAHNLRCCLDHLIYALAIRDSGADPPPKPERLQFPIFDSLSKFNQERHRIACLSDRTQARIERLQPYNRPHRELPPLLAILNHFDNRDKHRLLNVAMEHLAGGKFQLANPVEGIVWVPPRYQIFYLKTPIKDGTEFAYFTVDPPTPNMKYNHAATFFVSVTHPQGGPCGPHVSELRYVLDCLIAEVKDVLG